MSLVVYKYLFTTHYIQNAVPTEQVSPIFAGTFCPTFRKPTKTPLATSVHGRAACFPLSSLSPKLVSSYPGYGRPPHACIYIYPQLWSSSCLHFTFSTALSSVLSEGQRYKVLTVREPKIVFHAVVVDKWLMHR